MVREKGKGGGREGLRMEERVKEERMEKGEEWRKNSREEDGESKEGKNGKRSGIREAK